MTLRPSTMENIQNAIYNLMAFIQKENNLLREQKLHKAHALFSMKQQMLEEYGEILKPILTREVLVSDTQKKTLNHLSSSLRETIQENIKLIDRCMKVNEAIVKIFIDRRQKMKPNVYNTKGIIKDNAAGMAIEKNF